ncbi:MAG: hypothetical protein QNJ67_01980 [Kiloniellales bacterium]|nr:hypothetical protein [Kiloniellales bacterium]
MEFRPTPQDEPVELTFEEFDELVRAGTVRPKAQYRSKWTNYEWRPVDRIPRFLRLIPPGYKYEDELKERRAEIAESLLQAERQAEFYETYVSGELIESCYGLEPLEKVALDPGVVGAARFIILPSFATERVVTFRFGPKSLSLEGVVGEESVFHAVAKAGLPRRPYESRLVHLQGDLGYYEAPAPFTSWETFVDKAVDAPSCFAFVLDGVGYAQRVLVKGEVVAVRWFNPGHEREHARQTALVRAYCECLRKAGMGELCQV